MDCKKHARKHVKAQFELIIIAFHKLQVSYPSTNLKEAKKKKPHKTIKANCYLMSI